MLSIGRIALELSRYEAEEENRIQPRAALRVPLKAQAAVKTVS